MDHTKTLNALLHRQDLSHEEMTGLMHSIMAGELAEIKIAAILAALRSKGETVTELSAAVQVMRGLCRRVEVEVGAHLIDTCGTGGDGKQTFNVSTSVAFVASVGGARVAKHGNKSVSSHCGSADLLEAAGAELKLDSQAIATAINRLGFGFIFAPMHHQAMKHVGPVRAELGVRTMFNLLGPLCNPTGCSSQLIGLYSRDWLVPLAKTLAKLGSKRVLLIHSADGLDEISPNESTYAAELSDGKITEYEISPKSLGVSPTPMNSLQVSSAQESLAMVRDTLKGVNSAGAGIVALNAAAALYVAGISSSLEAGVEKAKEIIASGKAWQRLEDYVSFTKAAHASN